MNDLDTGTPAAGESGAAWVAPDQMQEHEVGSVAATITAAGIPDDVVRDVVASAQGRAPQIPASELEVLDEGARTRAVEELSQLWGDKFDSNLLAIDRYLATGLPAGMAQTIGNARLANGQLVLQDAATLQRLLGLAKGTQPALVGYGDQDIESIERFMRTDRAAYNRNEPLQARYRELLAQKINAGRRVP